MKPEGEQQKLSLFFRITFGMGNLLNVLSVVGLWFPYAVSFFSKVLSLKAHQVGTIVLVGQVAGGIFTPLTGILSDVCKCRIYGRRKILHLLGVLSTASSFYFLWHSCYGCKSEISYTIYFSVFAIMFQFGYAAMQVAPLALVPELAPSKQMKVELNSIRYGFQISGTLLAFVILFVLLDKLPKASIPEEYANSTVTSCDAGDSPLNYGDSTAFWVMAIIVIGLGVLMVIPFHVVVREKNTVLKKLKWYLWLRKPDFYLVMCVFVAAKISAIFSQQYLPFYFLDTLKMEKNSISIGPLVLYVASFISTVCVKRINKFIGEKMLYFLGTVFVWGAMIWIWMQPVIETEATFDIKRDSIYIAIILWGLGGSVLMVLSLSMISILTGEYTGSSAFVCGWVLFADRVSNGVLNKIALQLKPHPNCSEAGEQREAVFYRQLIVFTTFASTMMGLVGICLLALWGYYQKRQMKKIFANIQIKDTVGDTSSVYSEKLAGAICCSKCRADSEEIDSERQSLIHEPAFAADDKEQSLVESYRERLLTSSYHDQHQLHDNDFEISLAT